MRCCLRRNYRGLDHFGAAADFEDGANIKEDQEDIIISSTAPILAAEAISVDAVREDEDQLEIDHLDEIGFSREESGENQSGISAPTEQTLAVPMESSDIRLPNDQEFVESSPTVAPGYVPSEQDERIILELPSSMVRPLRVVRGTFQVCMTSVISSRLNFILYGLLFHPGTFFMCL